MGERAKIQHCLEGEGGVRMEGGGGVCVVGRGKGRGRDEEKMSVLLESG